MMSSFSLYADKLAEFVDVSQDGYAIFDRHDVLICCNQAFTTLFFMPASQMIGKTFADTMRAVYFAKQGLKIDTDNIDDWLARVKQLRRSRQFRLFEVDLIDGRWFLFSEQVLASGELLLQAKDITKQKIVEQHLNENARRLSDLALTDELTQIANRRSFVASVNSEISRCSRINAAVAFFLLDIDHFKAVNDTYGHQAGDKVLKEIASLAKTTLREYDIFGRMGGEEFGIFLAETSHDIALEVAERLRLQIAAHPFNLDGKNITVTVSIGLALSRENLSFEQLYADADAALYQAKHSGRNKVVIAEFCVIL